MKAKSPFSSPASMGDSTVAAIELLEKIDQAGSINRAATALGISYKAAWGQLAMLGNLSDKPLVVRVTGGSGGGGTVLTDTGREVLEQYRIYRREYRRFLSFVERGADHPANGEEAGERQGAGLAEHFVFRPIGTIHSPFTSCEGMPIQPVGAREVEGSVLVEPEFAEGLEDLEGFSHIYLFYGFHRSEEGYRLKVKPFMEERLRGLFATRAPRRPNPVGISVVELLRREGERLFVRGVDILDGTPLFDIKPYVPAFDAYPTATVGWMTGNQEKAVHLRADDRFSEKR